MKSDRQMIPDDASSDGSTKPHIVRLAKECARDVRSQQSALFRRTPVRASEVARSLGIRVKRDASIAGRAILIKDDSGTVSRMTILVNNKVGPAAGRFAIAHEVGHAILLQRHPKSAASWSTAATEMFADSFASWLLVGTDDDAGLRLQFQSLCHPSDFLTHAQHMGLSPSALMQTARLRHWAGGAMHCWLVAHVAPRPRTNVEPRLRVTTTCLDFHRAYLPSGRSLESTFGTIDWLRLLPVGEEVEANVNLEVWVRDILGSARKYRRERKPTLARAVLFRGATGDARAQLAVWSDMSPFISAAQLSR